MKLKPALFIFALSACLTGELAASTLFSEGFESYQLGPLDVNSSSGPNTNASNPWAGPFPYPDNCDVVTNETSNGILVTPHGGTKMARGSGRTADYDQDFYNLGYWLNSTNGGAAFTGGIYLDWWFFDQVGSGTNGTDPTNYCDFMALSYYPGMPSGQSYNPNLTTEGTQESLGSPTAQLAIGGAPNPNQDGAYSPTNFQGGFSKTNYQALILNNSTIGYDGTGYANLPVARSVGWHHARIEVSAVTNASNTAKFYVDNLSQPALTVTFNAPNGFNTIEMDANVSYYSPLSAYFDDISFGKLVVPTTLNIVASGTNAIVSWSGSHILQSSTNTFSRNFTDVLSGTNNVTSPYTNALSGNPRFFRLRN